MQLRNYPLNEELLDVLEGYARDHSLHVSSLIENLIEKFLYDEQYISVEYEDEVVPTPSEIYAERKSRFKKIPQGPNVRVYWEDFDYSSFDPKEVDDVIDKLSSFSDEELKLISKNNWKGNVKHYKKFLLEKLENPSLTIDEFLKNNRILRARYIRRGSTIETFTFNGKQIAQFNCNNYSEKQIEKSYLFLKGLTDEELSDLIKHIKQDDLISSESLLKIVKEKSVPETVFEKREYMKIMPNGKIHLVRKGKTFGTHDKTKANEVWNYLERNEWNPSLSTSEQKLKGKHYLKWLYSEMEKENNEKINENDSQTFFK